MDERDWHCIARLLQGALYGGDKNAFDGCFFCKFKCFGDGDMELAPNMTNALKLLEEKTGVDLSVANDRLLQSNFPYKKFLKNSNDEAKEYFRNYFKGL